MIFLISSIGLLIMWIIFANTRKFTGKKYNPFVQALAHLWGFLFGVVDVVFNVIFGSIIFMQFPHYKRLTLTMRLRHILFGEDLTWRWKLADFVCRRLIEPWDYNHCGLANE